MCLDRVNILTSGQIDHTGEPVVSFGSELRCSVEVGIRICESIEGKLMFQVEISSLDDIPAGLSEQHDRLRSSEWSAPFRPCLLNKFPQKHHESSTFLFGICMMWIWNEYIALLRFIASFFIW